MYRYIDYFSMQAINRPHEPHSPNQTHKEQLKPRVTTDQLFPNNDFPNNTILFHRNQTHYYISLGKTISAR